MYAGSVSIEREQCRLSRLQYTVALYRPTRCAVLISCGVQTGYMSNLEKTMAEYHDGGKIRDEVLTSLSDTTRSVGWYAGLVQLFL